MSFWEYLDRNGAVVIMVTALGIVGISSVAAAVSEVYKPADCKCPETSP